MNKKKLAYIIATTIVTASIPALWYGITRWVYPLAMGNIFGFFIPLGFAVGCILFGGYSLKGMGIGIVIPYSIFLLSYGSGVRADYPLLAIAWVVLLALVPVFGIIGFLVGKFLEKKSRRN